MTNMQKMSSEDIKKVDDEILEEGGRGMLTGAIIKAIAEGISVEKLKKILKSKVDAAWNWDRNHPGQEGKSKYTNDLELLQSHDIYGDQIRKILETL